MDKVFSVDDVSDDFWSRPPICSSSSTQPPPPSSSSSSSSKMMNRSSSEWAFQLFLQETSTSDSSSSQPQPAAASPPTSESKQLQNDVLEIKDYNDKNPKPKSPVVPTDSEVYQAFLKSQLNLACAAVALTRASYVDPRDSASAHDNGSQASSTSHLESQVSAKASGFESSKGQDMETGGLPVIPSAPPMQNESGIQMRSTSGSSREQSDDEEAEGEMEMTQNTDPAAAKRVRRMLSNRESARRSRTRKQAHLTDREAQVAQLRDEKSTLLTRLTGVTQKYSEAAVDNRVLKANIETLRAKVKMAEQTVKRVTRFNPLFQDMSDISSMHMPLSFAGSPSDTSTDAAIPISDDPKQHLYQPPPHNHIYAHDSRNQNGFADSPSTANAQQNPSASAPGGNKINRTALMQRVTSLEHLQKRISGGLAYSSSEE